MRTVENVIHSSKELSRLVVALGLAFLLLLASIASTITVLLPNTADAATTLNFTELATHPGAAAQASDQGKTINKLEVYNGKLYAAYGDYDANTGPISINPFDLTTNTFDGEALSVPTESLGNWKVIDGKLYTTTIDPTCSGTCPAGYAVGDSSHNWQMKTPVNAEHIFDVETLTGTDIWLFGSAGGATSTAWRSTDGGDTFDVVQTYETEPGGDNSERYYWGQALNGKMYMQSNYTNNEPIQIFDGTDWSTGDTEQLCSPGDAAGGPSNVTFGDRIVCEKYSSPKYLNESGSQGEFQNYTSDIDCSMGCSTSTEDMYSSNEHLYTLRRKTINFTDYEAEIIRTSDLQTKRVWSGLPNATRSFTIDEDSAKIYVGTSDSKIYVADLPAPDIIPPTVSITSPTNGQTINSTSVTLTANASDDNSGIARVEFFIGNDRIASDSQSPYRANWKNQYTGGSWQYPVGQYQFTAVAYDLDGNSQQSSAVTVTINPPSDITIEEFNTGLGNAQVALDDQDNVWFTTVDFQTGQVNSFNKLNSSTGQVISYALTEGQFSGFSPFNKIVYGQGRLWGVDCQNDRLLSFNVANQATGTYDLPDFSCSDGLASIASDSTGKVYTSRGGDTNRIYVLNEGELSQIDLEDGYDLATFAVNQQDQLVVNYATENPSNVGVGIVAGDGQITPLYEQVLDEEDFSTFLYGRDMTITSNNDIWLGTFPDFELALEGVVPLLTRINPTGQVSQIPQITNSIAARMLPGSDNGLWFVQNNGMVGRIDNGSSTARLYAGLVTPFPEGIFGDAEQTALANELYLGLYAGFNAVDSQGNMWLSDGIQSRILKITANVGSSGNSNQDSDPIPDAAENAAPNNGDANNDGTPDSQQPHVTSLPIPSGPQAGTYISLASPSGTTITAAAIQQAIELGSQDTAFDYPFGLLSFTIEDVTPGSTIPIELYYYTDQSPDSFIPRKYNPNTQAFTTLSTQTTTTLSQLTIDNQPVLKLSYQLTDGGTLDIDNEANGSIQDPVGLAQQTTNSPDTGLPRYWLLGVKQ